jgi:hypothetical protein
MPKGTGMIKTEGIWKTLKAAILILSRDDPLSVYRKCIPFLINCTVTFTVKKIGGRIMIWSKLCI